MHLVGFTTEMPHLTFGDHRGEETLLPLPMSTNILRNQETERGPPNHDNHDIFPKNLSFT